jgi:OmpA family/SPOR domain
LDEGKSIELTNVYYNYNDATLRPDALKDLRPLLAVMKQYPEIEIELGSHTDSRGNDPYNQELSQRRAESVKTYLTGNGIAPRRIKAVGYGETRLRNSCTNDAPCSEDDHQRNRRTEVTITKGVSTANISVVNKDPEVIGGKPMSNNNDAPIASSNNNFNTGNTSGNGVNISSSPVSSSGEFWVVAGSYHEQNNAQEQLEKLQRLGFNETSIEYAQDINFYRVVVKREYDLASATNTMRSLKRSRVTSTFVLRR